MSASTREHADHLANGIYGTIVAAGVLAATAPDADPGAFDTALYLLATVTVLWLAHAWAHALGHRAVGASSHEHRFAHALAADRALVASAFPPLLALGAVRLVGGDDETAIDVALWLCVGLLAGAGALIASRRGEPPGRILLTALGTGALGALLVLLKAIVH